MTGGWLIGYGVFLLLSWGWIWYELFRSSTDKELWGEEIE